MSVNLPLTGSGQTTATVATEQNSGAEYQYVKLVSGVAGSTVSGSTATIVGTVSLALGTSATYQFEQSIPFSSGNVSRSTIATSVDAAIIAANANRKALVIANGSTAQMVGIGLTTAAVTTARANINMYLQANSQIRFGLIGDFPLYLGPVRGINLTSTAVTGFVIVTEFT